MSEITSPGLLPPSIDYDDMLSRQSDVRNKVLAPVFKRLGLIDQWGNGLALIHDELEAYPNVRLTWREVGLSFQVTFEKMNPKSDKENTQESTQETVSKYLLDMLDIVRENVYITRNELAERLRVSPDAVHKVVVHIFVVHKVVNR